MSNSPTSAPTSDSKSFAFGIMMFLLFTGAIYVWITFLQPSWNVTPGESKDDVFYENIAYNLANDVGFALNFQDQDWLAPYNNDNEDGKNDWIEATEVSGPTATRGPALPYVISAIYRFHGRDWEAVRVFNMLILAFGLAWLVCNVRRYYGYLAATIAAATLIFDFGILSSAGRLITEAFGTGMMAITFSCLIWAWNSPSRRDPIWKWFFVGIMFGVTMLVRTNLAGWLIQLMFLFTVFALLTLVRGKNPKRFIQGAFLFLLAVTMVSAPWWIRNCETIGEFSPFGTAGSIGFVGGFSEEALNNQGNWYAPVVIESQSATNRERDMNGLVLAEKEYLMGADSIAKGRAWIEGNLEKLPELSFYKALNHLGLIGQSHPAIPIANGLLLFGMLVGSVMSWRKYGGWIVLITFLSVATTILTWSHHGRFAIPIRPLWHVGSAIGIVLFWSWVLGYSKSEPTNEKTEP